MTTKKHEPKKPHLSAVEESEKLSDEAIGVPFVQPWPAGESRKIEKPIQDKINTASDPAEALWRSENPDSTEKFCDLAPGYRAELLKRASGPNKG